MRTNFIRNFIKLTDYKNFSTLSSDLSISQSTLSNQISQLENELGIKLIERSTRKFKLTEGGKIFLKHAKKIMHVLEECKIELSENAKKEITLKRSEADKADKKGDTESAIKLRKEADKLEAELPTLDEKNNKRRKLRQAMSLAYNRPERIRIFENGRATAAQGPIPPEFNFFDPNWKNEFSIFDLEKAKKLLAEAGYPGGIGEDGKRLIFKRVIGKIKSFNEITSNPIFQVAFRVCFYFILCRCTINEFELFNFI